MNEMTVIRGFFFVSRNTDSFTLGKKIRVWAQNRIFGFLGTTIL